MRQFSKLKPFVLAATFVCVASVMPLTAMAIPHVDYTVSGSPGNYTLDFSFTNNLTPASADMSLYLVGVSLSARDIVGSPANYNPNTFPFLDGTTMAGGQGLSTGYNNNWYNPSWNTLFPGTTLSGFRVHITDLTVPTSVPWFTWGTTIGEQGVYTGDGNLWTNTNPFFIGVAHERVSTARPILAIDFSGAESEIEFQAGDDTPLQPGYVGWAGPYFGNPGQNYNETRSFGADFGVGGSVNVTVQSDGLFFRDYEPIVGGAFLNQSALLSDSILRNQPGSIFLTFNSLTDGVYSMTSLHHDTRFGLTFVPFNIILTDSLVTNQTLFSGLDTTGGTAPSTITKADYTFTVVGGSTVTIEFAGQAQLAQHMSINGFQLQRIGDAPNVSPVCSAAKAFPAVLGSPNHQFVPIVVMGVTDPDGDSVTITVTGVTQDEPVNAKGDGNTSPDAVIEAGATSVRDERSGKGNGRVYQVSFKAEDGKGGSCTGAVTVGVPHSLKKGLTAIDDGQVYDSTVP